ncbi:MULTISPECIES: hypothetical protein [Lactobacillus]|uniref:Uncharacterized protein n=1 Tax=Lactobacillus xujianguonis TaxID=2495899 RepID=A0A437SSU2_9LACO|nr:MULTISPECIES: hypothetical protein [Lactobacillus]RVU70029.1 hypothetical protein EJK17_09880 [Lactobacillus xujianguonis]RVU73440.1 hypothetical protein EJK20_08100 [Lactobacillus xujianguonis]
MEKSNARTEIKISEIKKNLAVIYNLLAGTPTLYGVLVSDKTVINAIGGEIEKIRQLLGLSDQAFSDYLNSIQWNENDPEQIELTNVLVQANQEGIISISNK